MSGQPKIQPYKTLRGLAGRLRKDLEDNRFVLLYAFNGVGKTRLSVTFKDAGKKGDERDTLYFNAFTEDLFSWDNDLDNDTQRMLRLNKDTRFFKGLQELEMENRIGPLLARYSDFNFVIDYDNWTVVFYREIDKDDNPVPIKVSRGEENIFIWCFFLVVAQLAIDGQEAYQWVKYIYIDDPISSLDDNNAIAVASHLAELLKGDDNKIKVVLSSHHTLFFNVMWNELNRTKKAKPYFLNRDAASGEYSLRYTGATPFFHHVALLQHLKAAADAGALYTYHFNMLRGILEKAASFHGFNNFTACLPEDKDDPDQVVYGRMVNVLSHGNYSLFEPMEMLEENKQYFRAILNNFMSNYQFNPALFP